ncbi:hypothetical protein SAMN05192574_103595 [Mucilaginibacter gossypiicola]|uniref:Uncharacterized protein n=1 Tax=Mucilaginibacter gossypiicola TaxID=551995 RepID=A0A1H8HQ77_9SPHI|nr:hypothetical protein SAMN05192574_103595 [Mucilaginibacter gossypiicola]
MPAYLTGVLPGSSLSTDYNWRSNLIIILPNTIFFGFTFHNSKTPIMPGAEEIVIHGTE